jgi:hypothetical protein
MSRRRGEHDLRSLSEHVLYEVQMMFRLADRLRAHVDGREELPWEVEMACIEAFAMHTRVLFEFLFHDPKSRFPDDGFASDFFAPGEWEQIRERVQRSALDGLWDRAGSEIAHISYKRTSLADEARHWEFDVIAAVIGRAFRLFLENVSPAVVVDGFEQRMRATWPVYLNLPIAISFPPDKGARSVATTTLQDLSDVRQATFEELLTRPD